jgi:hypothetical protein
LIAVFGLPLISLADVWPVTPEVAGSSPVSLAIFRHLINRLTLAGRALAPPASVIALRSNRCNRLVGGLEIARADAVYDFARDSVFSAA